MWIRQYSIAILIWISTYLEKTSGCNFDRYEQILADYKYQNIIPIHYYDNKLYYFSVNNKATYLEADHFCRNIHMRLVYLDSEKELQHLHEYANGRPHESTYWTAGSKLLDNKNYVWLTTADLVDENYWSNLNEDNGQCLTLKQSSEKISFESKSCNNKYSFICKRQNSEASVSCGDNIKRWSALFKNPLVGPNLNLLETTRKTYYFGTHSKLTYQQALQFCQIINMDLVSVTSEKANDDLGKYIQNHKLGKKFWSSGTKSLDGTNWVWLTEALLLDYTQWAPREPATDDKNCLALEEEGGNLVWKSSPCDTDLPFICQSTHEDRPNEPSELFKKFKNLTSVTNYITDMHQYLQKVGFIVGSLMSPRSHFIPNPESERSNATVNHIDYKTTEYITLLLEYLYDYVIKLSAIVDDSVEKAKYKTTDIRKVVTSIENWLYTIKKLLHPNDISSENKKVCNKDTDWEVCVDLLNQTIQEYALATGLIYVPYDIYTGIPVGKFPGGLKLLPGSMLPNITGPDSLETFDARFSKIISTIFRPMLVSLYNQNQSKNLSLVLQDLPNPLEEKIPPSEEPQTESGELPPTISQTEENPHYGSPRPEHLLPKRPLLPNLEEGQPPVAKETEENPYYGSPRPEHLLPKRPLLPNIEEGQPPIVNKAEKNPYYGSPRPELILPDRPPLPDLKQEQLPIANETEGNQNYGSPRPDRFLPERPLLSNIGGVIDAKAIGFEQNSSGIFQPGLSFPNRSPQLTFEGGQVINTPGYSGISYSGQVQSFPGKGGSQFGKPFGGQFGEHLGGQFLGSNYDVFNHTYGVGGMYVVQQNQMKIVEWTQDGRHFMQISYKATPTVAANICKDNGLELISIADPRTNEIITKYLSGTARGQTEFYWTSGQKQRYGNWRWGDGSPLTYTNWAFGQPDNVGGNDFCIRIDALGTWSDAPCNLEYNFLCGSPKEKQGPPPQFIEVPKPFIQISFGSRSLKNNTETTTSAPQ